MTCNLMPLSLRLPVSDIYVKKRRTRVKQRPTKKTYTHEKETYTHEKKTYTHEKETYTHEKETLASKETLIKDLQKRPTNDQVNVQIKPV